VQRSQVSCFLNQCFVTPRENGLAMRSWFDRLTMSGLFPAQPELVEGRAHHPDNPDLSRRYRYRYRRDIGNNGTLSLSKGERSFSEQCNCDLQRARIDKVLGIYSFSNPSSRLGQVFFGLSMQVPLYLMEVCTGV